MSTRGSPRKAIIRYHTVAKRIQTGYTECHAVKKSYRGRQRGAIRQKIAGN